MCVCMFIFWAWKIFLKEFLAVFVVVVDSCGKIEDEIFFKEGSEQEIFWEIEMNWFINGFFLQKILYFIN